MDKADLKELLGELLDEVIEEKLEKLNTKEQVKENKKKKYRRRNKKKTQTSENKFSIDDLDLTPAERKELAQASKSDKANKVNAPKQRMSRRRPANKIEVRCRSCGRTEKVSPLLVYKDEDGFRYKCNKCSCSPG